MPTDPLGAALLGLARQSIAKHFGQSGAWQEPPPLQELAQPGATFVTLTQEGMLRGCIGSLQTHRPLADDVKANALAAAFHDPRFPPLAPEELARTRIEVSLLSAAQPFVVADEADARKRLRPGLDGVILRYGTHRATFLPQVWETLPDPRDFLAQLKQKAGIHVTHIPYRCGPLGMADVIAGQVDVMFIAVTPALPHVRDGRLVALASGGAARHVLLPTVPTVAETYQGFQAGTWFGLFAPVNTPQAVVDVLAAKADRVLSNPGARAELAAQGVQATGYAQTRFRNQVQAESRRYALLAKQVGIKDD